MADVSVKTGEANPSKQLVDIIDRLLILDCTYDHSQKVYKEWAEQGSYDEHLDDSDNYVALTVLRDTVDQLFPDKEDALILDVGAGSGLSGKVLMDTGFKNIHALEPLKEFVDEAKKKGIYSKIFHQPIGFHTPLNTSDDTYDCLVSCGAFCPGHIPCDAFHEMARIVKPGGYIVHCMREVYLTAVPDYRDNLLGVINTLEKGGKLKKVKWQKYPRHFMDNEGRLMVFQVC